MRIYLVTAFCRNHESNAGGVGFYINEKIGFSIRDDITETI
jgi:hypothetical protein